MNTNTFKHIHYVDSWDQNKHPHIMAEGTINT